MTDLGALSAAHDAEIDDLKLKDNVCKLCGVMRRWQKEVHIKERCADSIVFGNWLTLHVASHDLPANALKFGKYWRPTLAECGRLLPLDVGPSSACL